MLLELRLLFVDLLIPNDCRTCTKHLNDGYLKTSSIDNINKKYDKLSEIKLTELMDTLQAIKNECDILNLENDQLVKKPPIDVDTSYRLTNNDYHTLTGLNSDQFEEVCNLIPTSTIYNTKLRSSRQAIACLLTKLRLGLTHQTLTTLFGLPSTKSFTRVLESARLALVKHFVPINLGFHHIDRDRVIKERTRPLPRTLLVDNQDKVHLLNFNLLSLKVSYLVVSSISVTVELNLSMMLK